MKKIFLTICLTIVSMLLGIVALVVCVDPFFHYHEPVDKDRVYLYNEMYQTPGMAKNFDYDTAVLGSSMTENFQIDWFASYGQNCVKLCYSGASSADIGSLLERIFESGNTVSRVYIDINDYQISQDPGFVFGKKPVYLYDENILTDIKYVLNLDVVLECIDILTAPKDRGNIRTAFCWNDPELFGTDKVLENLEGGVGDEVWLADNQTSTVRSLELVVPNMDNVLRVVRLHPETEFYIFYPPYSAAYWYDLNRQGVVDTKLMAYRLSMEELFKCSNVRAFFFMDDYDTIVNLDLYRDICHYNQDINRKLLEDMNKGAYEIDSLNYSERLMNLRSFIEGYEP